VPLHSPAQHQADGVIQAHLFIGIQGIGLAQWMEAGGKQGLVGVDVSQAGQEDLVEQQGFQPPLSWCEQATNIGR